MSFISMGNSFSNVQEKKPVTGGKKYDLVVSDVAEHISKDGKAAGATDPTSIKVTIDIQGHEDAPSIQHYLPLVLPGDDAKKVVNKMLMVKRFLTSFGIQHSDEGFDPADFIGATANLEVGIGTPMDNGMCYNNINLPFLPDESPVQSVKKAAKR